MKRIVICCDGTWNRPGKTRQTNVRKLFEAVLSSAADGTRQVPWYDGGVGTEGSFFEKLKDGAFGYGLGKNVQDAYTEIVRQYQPGDHLYLFGFSRGAYTARSTLGMVRKCGVLRPELIGGCRRPGPSTRTTCIPPPTPRRRSAVTTPCASPSRTRPRTTTSRGRG
jgi:uncharacterized protein (DUF2235 family)